MSITVKHENQNGLLIHLMFIAFIHLAHGPKSNPLQQLPELGIRMPKLENMLGAYYSNARRQRRQRQRASGGRGGSGGSGGSGGGGGGGGRRYRRRRRRELALAPSSLHSCVLYFLYLFCYFCGGFFLSLSYTCCSSCFDEQKAHWSRGEPLQKEEGR